MRIKKFGWPLGLAFILCLLVCQPVLAAPYMTITQGPNGEIVSTQTAYEPDRIIRYELNQPADVYYEDGSGRLYVADQGNARIAVMNADGSWQLIGEGVLMSPQGVYVTPNGHVYVADYGLKEIVVFDANGQLINRFGRPDEPIYGKRNDFIPKKVAVDKRGNIYVISEGSINGVVQLNADGDFLGYVGSNDTSLSMKMIIQRLLFTEEQRGQLFKTTPPSPSSLVLDGQGLLYTVTEGIDDDGIKKLNIRGDNILSSDDWASNLLIDIDVDDRGNIYTIDTYGWIAVYDSFGNLLFVFGGIDPRYERVGFLKNPAGIDVEGSGEALYVVDRDRGAIQRYRITPFAAKVFEAVDGYKQGLYVESQPLWEDILRMNSFFILSYQALAKAYFKQGMYEEALASFRLAEDKDGYSDAYWNIRNEWLQANMVYLIVGLIALFVIRSLLRFLHRKYGLLRPFIVLRKRAREVQLLRELGFMFHVLRHPIDAVRELKEYKRATVRSATILYGWMLILQVILIYATGYLFAIGDPDRIHLPSLLLITAVPLLSWVVMNYMVSTITDGEGRFSEVYICTIYALSPYLILALPVALVSNVLTYNEAFVYEYAMFGIAGWSVLLMFIMIKELHDYTLAQTIRNVLLTLFAIVLAALVLFILALLFSQEIEFIRSIIQELRNRG
jgi:tetratricopeptide (TPR) repeat protein